MKQLLLEKAVYYNPNQGPEHGTDVTDDLRAQIVDGALFYNGIYNNIFPDNFKRIDKKLRIELTYRGKKYLKIYSENEKINLPRDLGSVINKWWESNWFQVFVFVSAILGVLGFIITIVGLVNN